MESDFNIIKNHFLKAEQIPMRADEFVMKHIKFISGRVKLTNINFQNKDIENTKDVTEPMENNIEISTSDMSQNIISQNMIIETNLEDQCPACKNGDQPSGAHTCYICHINVHALDACSAPLEEEG